MNTQIPSRLLRYARPQAIYTFEQIQTLHLSDRPHLGFWKDEQRQCVQDSHYIPEHAILAGWGPTRWRYLRTTHESIPVFQAVDDQEIIDLCDSVSYADPYASRHAQGNVLAIEWSPRGLPRAYFEEPDDAFAARIEEAKKRWNEAQHEAHRVWLAFQEERERERQEYAQPVKG